jgi:hypothetical protein
MPPGLGKGGTGVLTVDAKEVARKAMDHSTPITFPEDETFDVALDTRAGVALLESRYDPPFKFTDKIDHSLSNSVRISRRSEKVSGPALVYRRARARVTQSPLRVSTDPELVLVRAESADL